MAILRTCLEYPLTDRRSTFQEHGAVDVTTTGSNTSTGTGSKTSNGSTSGRVTSTTTNTIITKETSETCAL